MNSSNWLCNEFANFKKCYHFFICSIENIPFIICTSKLSIQDQKYLNDIISKLNGIILTDWVKNCTHLTITKFTININVNNKKYMSKFTLK